MGISLADADRVAKLVPEELKMTLEKALAAEPQLKQLYDAEPQWKKVIDICRRIEGLARHASVHAAGVVIADVALDTLVPLYKPADSTDIITQFDGPTVEKIGLLKMDFLGLRTLSQIDLACRMVRELHGIEIDRENLDLADPRVYELLARGDTKGIFQFESGGMRDVLMKM
jgi:DNA polymerase-3 subunit alpha